MANQSRFGELTVEALEIPKERCLIVVKSDVVDLDSFTMGEGLRKAGFAEGSMLVFLRAGDALELVTDDRLAELGLRRTDD